MSAASARPRLAPVRCGLLAALALVAATSGACATDRAAGPTRMLPSAATTGPGISDCTARVDALIDSRTIPQSDREYAIGMCVADR
jgi:hypothetical protein